MTPIFPICTFTYLFLCIYFHSPFSPSRLHPSPLAFFFYSMATFYTILFPVVTLYFLVLISISPFALFAWFILLFFICRIQGHSLHLFPVVTLSLVIFLTPLLSFRLFLIHLLFLLFFFISFVITLSLPCYIFSFFISCLLFCLCFCIICFIYFFIIFLFRVFPLYHCLFRSVLSSPWLGVATQVTFIFFYQLSSSVSS